MNAGVKQGLIALFVTLSGAYPSSLIADTFGLPELQSLLEKGSRTHQPVQSIAELIPLLPRSMRTHFTFVYSSRSLFRDSISPDYPRAILFTPDAKSILSFTTDPEKPGFNVLEFISYVDADAKFELRKFVLPAALKKTPALRDTSNQTGQPFAHECSSCHGEDARPLFESYRFWPGFYGSRQDLFVPGSRELKNYRSFLRKNQYRPIFKDLIWNRKSSTPPYVDPKKSDLNKSIGNYSAFEFSPNTLFGMALNELNRKRIFRKLKASPAYLEKRPLILSELLKCGTSPISPQIDQAFLNLIFEEQTEKSLRFAPDSTDPASKFFLMEERNYAHEVAQIDWISKTLSIPRVDWSLALTPNSFQFYDGILNGYWSGQNYYLVEDFIYEIMADWIQDEARLKPFFVTYHIYGPAHLPFGDRINIDQARGACPFLNPKK